MDELLRPNSSNDSLKSYMTRFSSIFAKYGYVAFAVALLCYLLPIIGAIAIGLYFIIILCFTILLFIITLGVGFFLIMYGFVENMWSTFDNTTELYNKFVDISINISPVVSSISTGLLFLSLLLYIIFAQRKKTSSIVTKSIFFVLAIFILIFSLYVTVGRLWK